MSYGTYEQKKEHPFHTITKDIKGGNIKNVILLCGSEEFLVSWAAGLLVSEYSIEVAGALDFAEFDGNEVSPEQITEACETPPMMSVRKVVLVRNLQAVWGRVTNEFKPTDAREFAEYISKIPMSTLLIVTAQDTEEKKRSGEIYKAIKKNGTVYDFGPLSDKELRQVIVKRFAEGGKNITPRAMSALIIQSGYDNKDIDYALFNLQNDIKKIIALSDGDTVTEEDVIRGVSENLEHGVFKMMNAVSAGNKAEAFRLLKDILLSGESGFRLLALLVSQLELMLKLKEMAVEGMSTGAMANVLKISEYRARMATKNARKFSVRDLKRILHLALNIDNQIKSGALSETMALEMFIGQI